MSIGFTLEDLPEELGSKKEKADYIRKEIKKAANDLNSSGKASTEMDVRIGSLFNVLKKVVKKKKAEWTSYVEERFPYLNIRTIQRQMKLAKGVNLDKRPKLSFAGQTRLLALMRCVPKKGEVGDFLKERNFDLDFDVKKPKAVNEFQKEIDELIQNEKPSKKPPKVSISTSLSRVNLAAEKCKEVIKLAKEDKNLLKPVKPDVVSRTIKGIERLLEQLKKMRKRIAGKSTNPQEDE